MIVYSVHTMHDLRHRLRELGAIAPKREFIEYRERLKVMTSMGMHCIIAEDAGEIVGSIGYMPEEGRTGWTDNEKLQDATIRAGVHPSTVQVRSLIYVTPTHQGRGIGDELERWANKISRDLGFKYRAAFAYDTHEIFRWIHRHGNAITLDTDDPSGTGLPVSLIPIDKP